MRGARAGKAGRAGRRTILSFFLDVINDVVSEGKLVDRLLLLLCLLALLLRVGGVLCIGLALVLHPLDHLFLVHILLFCDQSDSVPDEHVVHSVRPRQKLLINGAEVDLIVLADELPLALLVLLLLLPLGVETADAAALVAGVRHVMVPIDPAPSAARAAQLGARGADQPDQVAISRSLLGQGVGHKQRSQGAREVRSTFLGRGELVCA